MLRLVDVYVVGMKKKKSYSGIGTYEHIRQNMGSHVTTDYKFLRALFGVLYSDEPQGLQITHNAKSILCCMSTGEDKWVRLQQVEPINMHTISTKV